MISRTSDTCDCIGLVPRITYGRAFCSGNEIIAAAFEISILRPWYSATSTNCNTEHEMAIVREI